MCTALPPTPAFPHRPPMLRCTGEATSGPCRILWHFAQTLSAALLCIVTSEAAAQVALYMYIPS